VKAQDILGHHVDQFRLARFVPPIFAELLVAILALRVADTRHVAGERVVPDVKNLFGIIRPRNAPLQTLAADRYIAQAALHEAKDFIPAVIRLHEFGMLLVEFEQTVLEGGKLEEVVLFTDQLSRSATDVAIHRVGAVRYIPLVVNTVPALVAAFVNETAISSANQQTSNRTLMIGMRRGDEAQ